MIEYLCMKIVSVISQAIADIHIINYQRFSDTRGYFTEIYNFRDISDIKTLSTSIFVQYNESFSRKNTVRGLHFQWNPFMGKLVRTIQGHMIDIILDIRPKSKTFGKAIMCDMPSTSIDENGQWLWIPPGFAHGNYFIQNTIIEYFCTGTYNAGCEMGINPFSQDIDWSLAHKDLYDQFAKLQTKCVLSPKDRNGIDLADWLHNKNSQLFI